MEVAENDCNARNRLSDLLECRQWTGLCFDRRCLKKNFYKRGFLHDPCPAGCRRRCRTAEGFASKPVWQTKCGATCSPLPGSLSVAWRNRSHTPRIFLKVCSTAQELMSILPCRWELQSPGFMMLCEGPMSGSAGVLPRGYFLDVRADGHAVVARILTDDRQLAASGRAVRHGAIFVYDQIGTDIGHRRRGLARLVMKALETEGRAASDKQVLVATQDGFGLYSALGWTLLSPYATAVILPGQS